MYNFIYHHAARSGEGHPKVHGLQAVVRSDPVEREARLQKLEVGEVNVGGQLGRRSRLWGHLHEKRRKKILL